MRPPPAEIELGTPSTTKGKLSRHLHTLQSGGLESDPGNMDKNSSSSTIQTRMHNNNVDVTQDPMYDGGDGDYSLNLGQFNEVKVPPPPTPFMNEKSPQPLTKTGSKNSMKVMKQSVKQVAKNGNTSQPSKSLSIQTKLKKLANQTSFSTKVLKRPSTSLNKSGKDAEANDKQMEEMDPEVGKLYDLTRRLGKGAYGVVWEAVEKRSGRRVALKKIYEAFRNTTDSQRTYREVVLLKAFGHHPNIISVIGGHTALNSMDLYLVFPLLRTDLFKVIDRNPAVLTEASTKKVAYQLILAINYLHSAEVIHRDLKPANVLLDGHLNVKLADLGLARSMPVEFLGTQEGNQCLEYDSDPELTDYVATRWYRPPEIIVASRIYTKSMDMWAFGCILGEMLLKKVVFAGDSANHQLQLIMQTINPPSNNQIEELCKTVDHRNVDVITTALEERGPSISEIFSKFDCSTVDIIERLLRFLPSHRLSVEGVLNHPYFYGVADPYKQLKAPGPFRPILDDSAKLEIIDYQNALYDLIDRYQVISDPHPFVVAKNFPVQGNNTQEKYADSSTSTETESNMEEDPCFTVANTVSPPEYGYPEQEYEYQIGTNYAEYGGDYQQVNAEQFDNANNYYANYEDPQPNYAQPSNPDYPDQNGYRNFDLDDNLNSEPDKFDEFLSSIPAPQTFSRSPMISPRLPIQAESSVSFPATKSVSDSATCTLKDKAAKRTRDNLSILTLASTKQDEEDKPEVFKKFELLCEKHDVKIEDYGGDLCWKKGNIKTPLKIDNATIWKKNDRALNVPSKEGGGENHYEYMTHSTFQKAMSGKPITPVLNRKGQAQPPPSPSSSGGRGDNFGDNFKNDDCDYRNDFTRIQETMTKNIGAGPDAGFVNPYKPKGRKTSAAVHTIPPSYNQHQSTQFNDSDPDFDEENDFFIRKIEENRSNKNSRQLSQVQNQNRNGAGDSRNVVPRIQPEFNPNISPNYKNRDNFIRGSSSSPNQVLRGSISFNETSGGNRRLKELFPSKEAIQNRIRQIETRVKGRASLSQSHDSFNYGKSNSLQPADGVITVNGRIKADKSNRSSAIHERSYDERERVPTDFAKSKFSFTPYSPVQLEPPPQPQRPFGGRSYNKSYGGPSFRRNPTHIHPRSFSDPEVNLVNRSSGSKPRVGVGRGRPPGQIQGQGRAPTLSSYFPNTSQLLRSQPQGQTRQPQNKMSHASNNDSSGFMSAMHQIPPVTSNINGGGRGQRMSSSNFRKYDYDTPPQQHQNKLNANPGSNYSTMASTKMSEFDKPASSTIKASELYTLRNTYRGTTDGLERKYLN